MLILQKSYFKKANGDRIQSIHLASPAPAVEPSDISELDIDLEKMALNPAEGIVIPAGPNFLMGKILALVGEKFAYVATSHQKFGAIVVFSKDENCPIGTIIPEFKGV